MGVRGIGNHETIVILLVSAGKETSTISGEVALSMHQHAYHGKNKTTALCLLVWNSHNWSNCRHYRSISATIKPEKLHHISLLLNFLTTTYSSNANNHWRCSMPETVQIGCSCSSIGVRKYTTDFTNFSTTENNHCALTCAYTAIADVQNHTGTFTQKIRVTCSPIFLGTLGNCSHSPNNFG